MKVRLVIGAVAALFLAVEPTSAQAVSPESALFAARAAYDQRADPVRAE